MYNSNQKAYIEAAFPKDSSYSTYHKIYTTLVDPRTRGRIDNDNLLRFLRSEYKGISSAPPSIGFKQREIFMEYYSEEYNPVFEYTEASGEKVGRYFSAIEELKVSETVALQCRTLFLAWKKHIADAKSRSDSIARSRARPLVQGKTLKKKRAQRDAHLLLAQKIEKKLKKLVEQTQKRLVSRKVVMKTLKKAEDFSETIIERSKDFLRTFEGIEDRVYSDRASVPNPTIGVGFNLARKDAETIVAAFCEDTTYKRIMKGKDRLSTPEIDNILHYTVCESAIFLRNKIGEERLNLIAEANPDCVVSLISLVFNCGPRFIGPIVTKCIENSDWEGLAEHIRQSYPDNPAIQKGLRRRRASEAEPFDILAKIMKKRDSEDVQLESKKKKLRR